MPVSWKTQGNAGCSSCVHPHKRGVWNHAGGGTSRQAAQRPSPVPATWWELWRLFFFLHICSRCETFNNLTWSWDLVPASALVQAGLQAVLTVYCDGLGQSLAPGAWPLARYVSCGSREIKIDLFQPKGSGRGGSLLGSLRKESSVHGSETMEGCWP